MSAPRPPEPPTEWLPSGFPPRSFPPGRAVIHPQAPILRTPAGRGGGRGRWLAAAAALVAALLLIAGILVARRGGGDASNLASGTSTSDAGTSVPSSEEATTAPAPPPSIDPVSTTVAGPSTTAALSPAAQDPSSGVLEPSATTLVLPKTDVTAGASRGSLSLGNSGKGALTFTAQSMSPGLSASPARGSIGPGASISVTVTLDGARIDTEGPYVGVVIFGGTGGGKTLQVQSVVGRPPDFTDNAGQVCPQPTASCSQQIKLVPTSNPSPTPCNTGWLYSITISDQSRIQGAHAIARAGVANADVPLQRVGSSEVFQSRAFDPIPVGIVLRFSIEAVDEFGFGRRLAEQTVAC